MNDQFNLGRHEALIERLVESQTELITRITSIEHILAEKRGERRIALWVASSAGGAIGGLTALLTKLAHHS